MNTTVINSLLPRLCPASVALALAAGVLMASQNLHLPERPEKQAARAMLPPVWPAIDRQSFAFEGATFKKQAGEQVAANLGPLARRFRLAGTFFAASNYQQSRKAIIDDIQKSAQCLVGEGDAIDQDIAVVSIHRDRVVLRNTNPGLAGGQEEQLWLSFAGDGKNSAAQDQQADAKAPGQSEATLSRFGKRTGERRWVLQRAAILGYYQELLNNPDRLASVFESLKPVYQAGKIAGYTLDVEGEGDVFSAFGLKQGDIIRKVNSMPMVSQVRAEYFINEFVKNRVNGFVIDIERGAQPAKLIYLIR